MIYVLFISAFIIIVLQHLFFWKSYKKPIARNGDFRIYAHRGYTGEAPDNTKESIDAAIKKGYGWVEIDIVSTKDNVVVCSHNFDLEKETDGLGYIYNHNYDSLKCVNIRSYNNSKNYKIPKLVDVLNLYGHKINYNIEIKVKKSYKQKIKAHFLFRKSINIFEFLPPKPTKKYATYFKNWVQQIIMKKR